MSDPYKWSLAHVCHCQFGNKFFASLFNSAPNKNKCDASNISRMFKCYVRNYIKLYNSHYSALL